MSVDSEVNGALVLGVAHDLGNLLGAAELRLQLPDDDGVQAARELLRDARALLARLRSLGGQHPRPAPLDLGAMALDAVALAWPGLRLQAAERGARVQVAVAGVQRGLPPVMGDGVGLRQAILNLLINACEAMPVGGTITVATFREEGMVGLSIEDEGTGIDPALFDKIFAPHFSTKARAGAGMGLAMVRQTVCELGGTVTARNRDQRGCRFELRLPARDPVVGAQPAARRRAAQVHPISAAAASAPMASDRVCVASQSSTLRGRAR
jgi:two-component system sensor histidine kinase HydH